MKIGVCLFVGCLTSQQHTSVSQGRICTDNFTCCHTEIEAADQTMKIGETARDKKRDEHLSFNIP